jgi:hypothetical protein
VKITIQFGNHWINGTANERGLFPAISDSQDETQLAILQPFKGHFPLWSKK